MGGCVRCDAERARESETRRDGTERVCVCVLERTKERSRVRGRDRRSSVVEAGEIVGEFIHSFIHSFAQRGDATPW